MINNIKELFEKSYGIPVTIVKEKRASNVEYMNKLLFTDVVNTLKGLVANSDFLRDEIGIDISGLEEQYFQAIDGLLRMSFTDSQVQIINYFIYEVPNDGEFEAKIEVKERKKTQTYSFKTAEDLWDALKFVK
jgi:hypothetical protein